MKEIKAIIQPFLLDRVLDGLHDIEGLPGVTVSEARAVSMERGHYEQIVKMKLEIMVPELLAANGYPDKDEISYEVLARKFSVTPAASIS